jgi:hypothetical protein
MPWNSSVTSGRQAGLNPVVLHAAHGVNIAGPDLRPTLNKLGHIATSKSLPVAYADLMLSADGGMVSDSDFAPRWSG